MIHLTEKALKQCQKIMQNHPSACGLKFGVKSSGCSGFAYDLDVVEEVPEEATPTNHEGLTVWVMNNNVAQLSGTIIDYEIDKFSRKFVYKNPNEIASCGCGESVSFSF